MRREVRPGARARSGRGGRNRGRAWIARMLAPLFLARAAFAAGPCPEPASCVEDYLRLPSLLPPGVRSEPPLSLAAVDALVKSARGAALVEGPLSEGELAAAMERALNLGFLRRGMGERPLEVEVRATPREGYEERALVLRDPFVGSFQAILLVPGGRGPFPAVIALHGHGDRAETFRDDYHGKDYPSRGLAILMLTLRAMNIDEYEHSATQQLLANGLHLMGLRVYETLLTLEYLQRLPEIDAAHIGLIGHSGGSSTANLVVRLEPAFHSLVSDHQVDYYESDPREPYHCETVPGLYPLHRLINDFSTARAAVKQVRYGSGGRKLFGLERWESAAILDFFAEQLGRGEGG